MRVDSVASAKRIPLGTKLYLVGTLMGSQKPSLRTLVKVGSRDLQFRVDDPDHKNYGKVSYLSLPSGTKIEATPRGFIIYEPLSSEEELRSSPSYPGGEISAEYEFA